MTTLINAVASTGLVNTPDGSGIIKVQSNGVTTNALAWVYFNGGALSTTAGNILVSYNVSSITVNGTGDYTVNFTNSLSSSNYPWSGSAQTVDSVAGNYFVVAGSRITAPSTSALRMNTFASNSGSLASLQYVSVIVFGN